MADARKENPIINNGLEPFSLSDGNGVCSFNRSALLNMLSLFPAHRREIIGILCATPRDVFMKIIRHEEEKCSQFNFLEPIKDIIKICGTDDRFNQTQCFSMIMERIFSDSSLFEKFLQNDHYYFELLFQIGRDSLGYRQTLTRYATNRDHALNIIRRFEEAAALNAARDLLRVNIQKGDLLPSTLLLEIVEYIVQGEERIRETRNCSALPALPISESATPDRCPSTVEETQAAAAAPRAPSPSEGGLFDNRKASEGGSCVTEPRP